MLVGIVYDKLLENRQELCDIYSEERYMEIEKRLALLTCQQVWIEHLENIERTLREH